MFHAAAFYGSLPISSIYAQLPAVADGGLTKNAANLYIAPVNLVILAGHAQGVTTSRCQIQAPSLRNIAYPEIYPIVQSIRTAIPDVPGIRIWKERGPRLLQNEAFGLYASENGTGASPTNGLLLIGDRLVPAPPGPIITLVATSTIVMVDQQWTLGTLAFETQLAAGEYTVVGFEPIVDNANYARLLFPGGTNWRPGCPVMDVYGDKSWLDSFRVGNFGSWGSFVFNNPPQIEVFGAAAGSTPGIYMLDVVKTA